MNDDHIDYSIVHGIVYGWVENKVIPFNGTYSDQGWRDLDKIIFQVTGMWDDAQDFNIIAGRFNAAISEGRLDVSWLDSPYGATLFRIKCYRMGITL